MGAIRKSVDNKLTAMMIVRNEEKRFLRTVLDDLSEYVDEIVIVDDGSEDLTPEICASYKKVVSLTRSDHSEFGENEARLRRRLFWQAVATQPDWILAVDADEMFENRFKTDVRTLMNQTEVDWYAFRFYHFWNSLTHYRVDKLWAPTQYGPRLFRYLTAVSYRFNPQELHGGSVPVNVVAEFPGRNVDLRIKHYGYAGTREDIYRKYLFYTGRDPASKFCPRSHYDSMLDFEPVLERWEE